MSFFSHNGNLYSDKENFFNHSFGYGYGVFTSAFYCNGEVLFFKEHLTRLKKSCQYWKINYERISLLEIRQLVEKNKEKQGKIKILFFQNFKDIQRSCYYILFSTISKINSIILKDVNIYNVNEIDRHKTCNYMNVMSHVRIKDEILIDIVKKNLNNQILETGIGNIALIIGNVLQVIDTNKNILVDGIFQRKLIENYRLFFDKIVYKKSFFVEELKNADSVLHLNSVRGINFISQLDEILFQKSYRQKIQEINDFFFNDFFV